MQQSTGQTSWLGLFKESQNYYKQMKPQLEHLGAHAEHRRIALWCSRFEMKCLEGAIRDFMAKSGYNPNQPRVPAGNADGGEWTSGGGGAGARGNPSAREPSWGQRGWQETFGSKPAATDELPARRTAYPPIPKRPDGTVTISQSDWQTYHDNIHKGPKLSETERSVYEKIFAMEGGYKSDGNTVAGITPMALRDAKKSSTLHAMLDSINSPKDLVAKPELVPYIYRNVLDRGLDVGGSAALDEVGNKYAAAALGDVVFREGKKGAGEIMMNAVNATLKENKMPLLDISLE